MNERQKELSIGAGKQTRQIVLIDNVGLLTKTGREAHKLVGISQQLYQRQSKRRTFGIDYKYVRQLKADREELCMSIGISDKRRTRKKQVKKLDEILANSGYPSHWINIDKGPGKKTGMDATVIYSKLT